MLKTTQRWSEEIKRELNKLRDIPCLWTGRTHEIKMWILYTQTYRFSAIHINISARKFCIDNIILKFMWKGKRTKLAKTILLKIEVGGISLPKSKTYSIQPQYSSLWYWQRDRYKDQQTRGPRNTSTKRPKNFFSTGENLQDLEFLGLTPKACSIQGKIGKLDVIKIKNFWCANNPVSEKTSCRMGENTCKPHIQQRTGT